MAVRVTGSIPDRFPTQAGRPWHLHSDYFHHRDGDIQMSVRAMKAGAIEFLTKPFRDQELLDAIHVALEKDGESRQRSAEVAQLETRFASLTPRERQVLPLVVSGLPNKLIAAELGISEACTKVHRSQLMRKMRADSLPDLVRMAGKIGFPARSNPENQLR